MQGECLVKTKATLFCMLAPIIANISVPIGCYAQSHSVRTPTSEVRGIDFRNFTYHPYLCSREYAKEGIGPTVRLRNGQYHNNAVYYGIVDNKIVYGDLTRDSAEEAVVHISCGYLSANYGLSEIFVFTADRGKPTVLAELSGEDLTRAYSRYFPGGILWRITDSGVKINGGNLLITAFADGSHASPKHTVTFRYRWNGNNLRLTAKPKRTAFMR
jgi:hypothetical protein